MNDFTGTGEVVEVTKGGDAVGCALMWFGDLLGPNSIEQFWLEFWLENSVGFWLENPLHYENVQKWVVQTKKWNLKPFFKAKLNLIFFY